MAHNAKITAIHLGPRDDDYVYRVGAQYRYYRPNRRQILWYLFSLQYLR